MDQVPQLLLNYFKKLSGPPATTFHIAGYKKEEEKLLQHVYILDIKTEKITRVNTSKVNGEQGATWAGETDILSRLISQLYTQQDTNYLALQNFPIPFQFFTLQDAVDFAVYAVKTTIDAMRFMARPKTVGGPIDVLVIKPDQAEWVQKKSLHV